MNDPTTYVIYWSTDADNLFPGARRLDQISTTTIPINLDIHILIHENYR
jgi:hypothetical protein